MSCSVNVCVVFNGSHNSSVILYPMERTPVLFGYPIHVICTGAGSSASVSRRLFAVCPVNSIRMSTESPLMHSASSLSFNVAQSRHSPPLSSVDFCKRLVCASLNFDTL